MGWTTDATILRFTSAAKPTPTLHGVAQAGDQSGVMHPDEETPAVGAAGAGCLRPDVGGCPDMSNLPEDG